MAYYNGKKVLSLVAGGGGTNLVIDTDISSKTLQELYDTYGSCFFGKVGAIESNVLFMFYKSPLPYVTAIDLTLYYKDNIKYYKGVSMSNSVVSTINSTTPTSEIGGNKLGDINTILDNLNGEVI